MDTTMKAWTKESVAEKVIEVIGDQYIGDPGEVEANDRLIEELNFDSLDLVEVGLAVEDAFTIELYNEEDTIEQQKTVQDVINVVVKLLKL